MREISEVLEDLKQAKKRKNLIKKECGKSSIEYFEAKEDVSELKEELEFLLLHS